MRRIIMGWRDFKSSNEDNLNNNNNNNGPEDELNCFNCLNCNEEEPERKHYTLPYFDKSGGLVIPFDSDPKYHWWRDGQSISKTINELSIQEAAK
jgi:hypothetical protein